MIGLPLQPLYDGVICMWAVSAVVPGTKEDEGIELNPLIKLGIKG